MNNQDRQLPVFCLSNKWYDEFTAVGDTDLVVASQIPALRQYCQTITADAQLDEAKHYLRSKLPALLTSLELWVTSTIAAQNQQSRAPSSGANTVMNRVRLLVRRLGTEVRKRKMHVYPSSIILCFTNDISGAQSGRCLRPTVQELLPGANYDILLYGSPLVFNVAIIDLRD